MYPSPADFYLSCPNVFACVGSGVLSVVMREVYGKQRSEKAFQAEAVTTVPSLPSLGYLGGRSPFAVKTAVFCLCVLIFGFKIKTCVTAVNDAYWLASHKLQSSLQLALPWLRANAAIDHLINWKKIKGTVICCVSALVIGLAKCWFLPRATGSSLTLWFRKHYASLLTHPPG